MIKGSNFIKHLRFIIKYFENVIRKNHLLFNSNEEKLATQNIRKCLELFDAKTFKLVLDLLFKLTLKDMNKLLYFQIITNNKNFMTFLNILKYM